MSDGNVLVRYYRAMAKSIPGIAIIEQVGRVGGSNWLGDRCSRRQLVARNDDIFAIGNADDGGGSGSDAGHRVVGDGDIVQVFA